MRPKGWIEGVRYCVLGAVNGWLFGTFAWGLNELHLRHSSQAQPNYIVSSHGYIIDLADPIPPGYGGVVILCMLTFAIVSYGVHHLTTKATLPLLLLWQLIGLCSFGLLLVVAQTAWRGYFFPPLKGWVLLLGLGSAVVSSFVLGIIVEAASKVYAKPHQGRGL